MRLLLLILSLPLFALEYPRIEPGSQVDEYHGTRVADPYRILEDASALETLEWIDAENALTSRYLEAAPQRQEIRERLERLWGNEKYSSFERKGERYFFSKNNGQQNQPVVYTFKGVEEPEVLLDPNEWAADGSVSLTLSAANREGKWFAYALTHAGSDWLEIRIRDVDTKTDLSDRLLWSKFTRIAWLGDGKGFFYCRFDAPDEASKYTHAAGLHQVYYHELGTEQEQDQLIYLCPSAKYVSPTVVGEGKYLLLTIKGGENQKNEIFYQKLGEKGVKDLLPEFEARNSYVGSAGSLVWFITDREAPLKKVISVDLETGEVQEVIPEGENALENVSIVGGKLVAHYLKDACSLIQIFSLRGVFEGTVSLPGLGRVEVFSGESADEEMFFSFCNFTQSLSIYRYEFSSGKVEPFLQPKLSYSPSEYTIGQVFYESLDGTKIPLFLCHKKDLSFDRPHCTYLYGYGGFGISMEPFFSEEYLAWMERGGVLAVANLRGGSEYGEKWHEAGMLEKKQNVFDDFIAAAEWLIEQKIATPAKLAIGGRSNGGLLVGACLNQRPELFGATFPMVGVQDMLRFQRFTAGKFWTIEYGSSDNPEQFPFLYRYSPLHNIQKRAYPPTFIFTADHDDRVVPAHSYKYAATLQAAQVGSNPILIRITAAAGHGMGKPRSKLIEEATEKFSFLSSIGFFD